VIFTMKISQHFLLSTLALSTTAHALLSQGPTRTAFSNRKNVGKPALEEFAKIKEKMLLNLRLDITGEKNEGHFPLDGLQLELFQDKASDDHLRPVMPGANSKHAALSTGIRKLHVINEASFIGMNGMQHAHLENGCWEITWRDGDPSGALVCGFDVPKEMKRNANSPTLPSGRIYISLRLWSEDGLDKMQQVKDKAELVANQHLEKRHHELEKMQQTNNIFMKVLHRGNSMVALDKSLQTGLNSLVKDVPSDDKLMILDGGLRLRSDGDVIFDGQTNRSLIGNVLVLPGRLHP